MIKTESARFALLGHPVAHSVSPAIHQAAYAALGASHRYELVDCPDADAVRRQVQRLARGELAGLNVTVPHKRLALELADRADESARQTGVANVLSRDEGGALVASNTDAAALADELSELSASREVACVIGAGGAAQAAVVACKAIGIGHILVSSRGFSASSPESSWEHAALFRGLGALPLAWPPSCASPAQSELLGELGRADVIVQATSAGMAGAGPGRAVSEWIPWAELPRRAVAYDVVYNPARTPFLEAAEASGLICRGGLGMLVRQAARAIEIWLGVLPPIAPLLAAAEAALASRAQAAAERAAREREEAAR